MNHRTYICLLAAATLAACGQPPSPGAPRAVPQAEITTPTTTTTTTPTTAQVVTPAPPPPVITTPPPKPPPPRPTTTKPPPPKPKPPNRLVITAELRGSIEERTSQPFAGSWAGMQSELENLCPAKKPCVGYALVADPTIENEQDCFIGKGGIKVPDPLYEGGKITFRVNNTRCPKV